MDPTLKELTKEIERLTKELEEAVEMQKKLEIDVDDRDHDVTKLEVENARLKTLKEMDAGFALRQQGEIIKELKAENAELKKQVEWLPNSEQVIKELEAENASLKAKLAICDEVDNETQTMIEAADKLIVKNGDLEQEVANLKAKLAEVENQNSATATVESNYRSKRRISGSAGRVRRSLRRTRR